MNTPFSRPFLLLCGLLYLGFGLAVLLMPEPAAYSTTLDSATGGILRDLHGTHGGLNTAAGLFLLFAAFSGPWHRPGILLVALMNGAYLSGRIVHLSLEAVVTTPLLSVMLLEAVLCAIAIWLASEKPSAEFYRR